MQLRNTEQNESFEEKIEKEIIEKGLTAPRVTKEQVDSLYGKLEFSLGRLSDTRIMCSAVLDGFSIADGFGACVDPKNFDEEVGSKIAQKNASLKAYEELWRLEGYRLSRSIVEAAEKQSIPEEKVTQ